MTLTIGEFVMALFIAGMVAFTIGTWVVVLSIKPRPQTLARFQHEEHADDPHVYYLCERCFKTEDWR